MFRLLAALVIAGVAAVFALFAWPQLLDLQRDLGFAQVVSLRGSAAVVGILIALLFGLFSAIARGTRRFFGALAVLALLFSIASGGIVALRGLGGPGFETPTENDIRVLAWNTLGGAVTPDDVAELAVESQADVVSLPETTAEFADEVVTLAAAQGLVLRPATTAYDQIARARSTSLLLGERLGAYDISDDGVTAVLPSVVATSSTGGPTIVAVHGVAPVPLEMTSWRSDLSALAQLCTEPGIILAGDFNATLDAFAGLETPDSDRPTVLGGCADAAQAADAAGVGSWPTSFPPILGAPIDHVLVGSGWQVTGFRVILDRDGAGSDHRPILAQLRPAN